MSVRKWGWGHDVSEAAIKELGFKFEWHEIDGDEICAAELELGASKDDWVLMARPYFDGVQLSLTLMAGPRKVAGSRSDLLEIANAFNRESSKGAATISDENLFSWDEMLDLPRQLVERRLRTICTEILVDAIETVKQYADAISAVTFGGCSFDDVKCLVLPLEGTDDSASAVDLEAYGLGSGDDD